MFEDHSAGERRSLTKRATPTVHPIQEAPMCTTCRRMQLTFFDPSCTDCLDLIYDPGTSISEIFAVIRQWVPQIQQHIHQWGQEVSVNVNKQQNT